MKKIILLVGLALAGVAAWYFWETRPKPNQEVAIRTQPKPSKHSAAFNHSMDSLLRAYYTLSESLVKWDSGAVEQNTVQLQKQLGHVPLQDQQNDSSGKTAAQPILKKVQEVATAMSEARNMEKKRRAFHDLSQNMYQMLRVMNYDAQPVYYQECPMAFNDTETGNWLSRTAAIRNPYLGLHHPKYKSGMLECGETKDSLQ